MSAETVIKKIQDKAQAEAELIKRTGRADAEALRTSIIAEANEKTAVIAKRAKDQAELILKGGVQQAELDNRISYLNCQHALLDRVKEKAKEQIRKYDDKKWFELYLKLIDRYAMNGKVTIQASPEDIGKFKSKAFSAGLFGEEKGLLSKLTKVRLLSDHLTRIVSERRGKAVIFTLDDEPADIEGGVILVGEEYDVDLSYDAILDEIFQQNEKEIADSLFGAKASGK
jgi:vacuolar-type H+-ATPase subunit E/Vma4